MPYKDKSKKAEYQREYMRTKRSNVRPPLDPVRPKKIPGLIIEGNRILGVEPVKEEPKQPGTAYISDFDLDADGNIIPNYT